MALFLELNLDLSSPRSGLGDSPVLPRDKQTDKKRTARAGALEATFHLANINYEGRVYYFWGHLSSNNVSFILSPALEKRSGIRSCFSASSSAVFKFGWFPQRAHNKPGGKLYPFALISNYRNFPHAHINTCSIFACLMTRRPPRKSLKPLMYQSEWKRSCRSQTKASVATE